MSSAMQVERDNKLKVLIYKSKKFSALRARRCSLSSRHHREWLHGVRTIGAEDTW